MGTLAKQSKHVEDHHERSSSLLSASLWQLLYKINREGDPAGSERGCLKNSFKLRVGNLHTDDESKSNSSDPPVVNIVTGVAEVNNDTDRSDGADRSGVF